MRAAGDSLHKFRAEGFISTNLLNTAEAARRVAGTDCA
jgi:hypothetical protein